MKKNEFKKLLKEWMSNADSGCFHIFKGEDNSQKGSFIYIFCSDYELDYIPGSYLDDESFFNELNSKLDTSPYSVNTFGFKEHKKCMSNDPYCLSGLPKDVVISFQENLRELSGLPSAGFIECLAKLGSIFDSFYILVN